MAAEESRRGRLRRRGLWVVAVLAALLALILTPPLINVSRLAKRIASSMSESLGRPVHLDNVSLHVLPVPGLTLENLVVSEDPSFGSEPVIRANKVIARLRLSSLWRRQVEFSKISFEVDDGGGGPSVNLVRRADGRWNIESILLHAAQQEAAPTGQQKAGPAPRFPYMEANGARVNVKMGDEKMPLALTDAEFALWLPSPQQWKVRLEGRPARTDTNVSDTGVVTAEATLQRAARVEDVPIEMTASWRRAPLGEATRVLTGSDAGWRGSVEGTATLRGTLGSAALTGTVKLSGLRRADFIPAKMLDLNMECVGRISVAVAVLREPACTVSPTPVSHIGFGAVTTPPESAVYTTADEVALTGLKAKGVRLGTPGVRLEWVMDFLRLWSQQAPVYAPQGKANGSFALSEAGWTGQMQGTIAMRSLDAGTGATTAGARVERPFSITSSGSTFALSPFNLTFAEKTALMLSGTASRAGVNLRIEGNGTLHQASFLEWAMPPLGQGFKALPPAPASGKIDVMCSKVWGSPESCVAIQAPEPKPAKRRRR